MTSSRVLPALPLASTIALSTSAKVNDRKRHIAIDTTGMIVVATTPAGVKTTHRRVHDHKARLVS
jgi:hypothetical protein